MSTAKSTKLKERERGCLQRNLFASGSLKESSGRKKMSLDEREIEDGERKSRKVGGKNDVEDMLYNGIIYSTRLLE